MNKPMTLDARFVKTAAFIDKARASMTDVSDPKAKAALEDLATGLHALLSLLAEREADANGWSREETHKVLNA